MGKRILPVYPLLLPLLLMPCLLFARPVIPAAASQQVRDRLLHDEGFSNSVGSAASTDTGAKTEWTVR